MLRMMPWAERLALLRAMRSWRMGLAVALSCLAHATLDNTATASWRCLGASASSASLQPQAGTCKCSPSPLAWLNEHS